MSQTTHRAVKPAQQPREVAAVTRIFCNWARTAGPNDWCQYHVGWLGLDRAKSRDLNELAETVLLLQEHGYVRASQMRVPHDTEGKTAYMATRTGTGYPPGIIIDCKIGALDYRALLAIKKRAADQSAARALRYALALPENSAIALLESLADRDMITRAAHGGGWDLADNLRSKVF